jgi:hypothetical protein
METGTKVDSSKPAPQSKLKKVLIGLLIFVACAGGAIGGVLGGIAGSGGMVKGTWKTNYGQYMTVTDGYWYTVSSWGKSATKISKLTGSYAITQNSADDAYNPSKWVKTEYHATADGWAFCSSVYDAETAAAAEGKDTATIYKSADAAAGCNGFPHSLVTPYAMPIAGNWKTNWDETLSISATECKGKGSGADAKEFAYRIEAYGESFILMQNPADSEYNPSKWTLVEFKKSGSEFSYCMSVYDGANAVAALTKDTSSIYDAANSASGCNGFGHTVAKAA